MTSVLDESLRQLEAVLDVLGCGAALVRPDGSIVYINQRLARMMRRDARSLQGKSIAEAYNLGTHPEEVREKLSDLIGKDTELSLPVKDSEPIPVLVSASDVRVASAGDLLLLTMIDLSRQKQAEAQLKQHYEFVVQMSNTVMERALDLRDSNEDLEQRVRLRTIDLRDANLDAIFMLAVASEAKDEDTGRHVRRIQGYSAALALRLGMDERASEAVGHASILHDVGKMQVPDGILKKPGPLTEDERRMIQRHTLAGERILANGRFFDRARQIARSHHENFDGSGYPDQRAAHDIPLEARIVHLVDVFDALVTERVYKPAWPWARALETVQAESGAMFDPELTRAFMSLAEDGTLKQVSEQVARL